MSVMGAAAASEQQCMASPSRPSSDGQQPVAETVRERLIAAVLRRVLRALLLPTFRADRPISQQRVRLERILRLTLPPAGVDYRASAVSGISEIGAIRGEVVSQRSGGHAAADRVVLYLHGGAYCVGSPQTHRAITGRLAMNADAHVFALDYRLAPEHPFPAALEDAVAAFRGLLAAGFESRRITLAGDSAGGGLAVATAVRLRELGLATPAALVLLSPWVDLAREHPEPPLPSEVMLSGAWVAECARHYLAGRAATEPLASPITADLRGLPPTLIQAGTDETLLDDSQRLHAALSAANGVSELQVYPHRWHVFQANAGVLADADRALARAGAFIRARA
jgi:monoterpene epsilon-lactone hydrolase